MNLAKLLGDEEENSKGIKIKQEMIDSRLNQLSQPETEETTPKINNSYVLKKAATKFLSGICNLLSGSVIGPFITPTAFRKLLDKDGAGEPIAFYTIGLVSSLAIECTELYPYLYSQPDKTIFYSVLGAQIGTNIISSFYEYFRHTKSKLLNEANKAGENEDD